MKTKFTGTIGHPKPIGARLLIGLEEVKTIGNFQINSPTAIEIGKVLAIGNSWNHDEEPVKVGDTIHFKSWALDCITIGDGRFYYLWQKTGGLCGAVKLK